ncbi:MAG: creatininase family protein [Firmicutes bacterium]|nr:creatininase family protein [Bacillota bacterium]
MTTVRLADLTSPEAGEALSRAGYVIVPFGSCEQHGPHLPLDVDSVVASRLAEMVAIRVGGVVLPVVGYGQVWSAKGFPGTISLRPETLVAIAVDICESLVSQGVERIILLSGHLGNLAYLREAARIVFDRHESALVWHVCYPNVPRVTAGVCTTPLMGGVFHAGELETSIMLHIDQSRCHVDRAVREYSDVPPDYGHRPVKWSTFSRTGVFGDATAATAEKGKVILERLADEIAFIVRGEKGG